MTYDDWVYGECDYCGQDRKLYLQEDLLPELSEPLYYCSGEDCKELRRLV